MENDTFFMVFVKVYLILGLFIFAAKVPNLIKELFPKLGKGAGKFDFGLNPKKEIIDPLKSSPFVKTLSPVGLLTRKTIRGIDSAKAGYGFSQGWKDEQGKFKTWINKQQEKYTPYSYEQAKKRAAGDKEFKEIDHQWRYGVKVAEELIKKGLGTYGTANGWDKALDGTTKANYSAIFRHNEFITSKMNLDAAQKLLDDYKAAYELFNTNGHTPVTVRGVTYNSSNIGDLFNKIGKQTSSVASMEKVHNTVRKKYEEDAKTEDAYKFIKKNTANPTSPAHTHTTEGI